MSPVSRVQVQSNRPSVTEQVRLNEELMVGGEMVPTVSEVKVMGGGLGRVTTGGVERCVRYIVNSYCILLVPDSDVQISTSVKRSQSICSVFENLNIIVKVSLVGVKESDSGIRVTLRCPLSSRVKSSLPSS